MPEFAELPARLLTLPGGLKFVDCNTGVPVIERPLPSLRFATTAMVYVVSAFSPVRVEEVAVFKADTDPHAGLHVIV